jgi:hypothetical protein
VKQLSRRRFLTSTVVITTAYPAAVVWCQPVDKSAEKSNPEKTAAEFFTADAKQAVQKGLAFLAKQQQNDGSFGRGGYSRNVAICALSGLAFLSSGSTPGRGPYGRQAGKCVDYLLDHTEQSGFIAVPGAQTHGPMYGHGFSAMFLAEAYGMTMRRDIREKLSKSIELIVNTQNREGGWRYQPIRSEADISVTICQVMALRAARNAGLHVPKETIDRSIDYVKRSQNADGGFMYMIQGGPSEFPRSAAGVVALYSAGVYEGREIDKGLEYLLQFTPSDDLQRGGGHFFYGQYYAVQAMWHAGGESWRRWYPAIRDVLLKKQNTDGAWDDGGICREYGTAMSCIILQIPNNTLPIFQR